MNKKLFNNISYIVFSVLILSSCATSPTGRNQMILKSEASLELEGERQFRKIRETLPLVSDQRTINFVESLGSSFN